MSINAVQRSAWSYVLDEPTKVLVADDDPILREFASVHLSSPAAVIETASDGASALSLLTGGSFDIALLDIEMPSLDGFSLLERIRAAPALCHLPVIMLTGHEDIASIDRAFSLGANSFVTKPVNWRLLTYHVRYVLRTSRVQRELRKARRQAETKEAAYNRALLAFEVECRGVLRSILQLAAGGGGDGSPSQADALSSGMQQIAELAAAAIGRWDDHSSQRIGSPGVLIEPKASGLELREPDRWSSMR